MTYAAAGTDVTESFSASPETPMMLIMRATLKQVAKSDVFRGKSEKFRLESDRVSFKKGDRFRDCLFVNSIGLKCRHRFQVMALLS